MTACRGPLAEPPDPAVAAAPYPSLDSVPQLPIVHNTLDQRKQLGDALASDLAAARYERDQTRHELGLATAAPTGPAPSHVDEPAPVPGGVPAIAPPALQPLLPGGGPLQRLSVQQEVLTERNTGRLSTFLQILQRQRVLDKQMEAAGLSTPADAPEDFSGRPLPPPLATLTFATNSVEPPADAEAALTQAVAAAQSNDRPLTVEGAGVSRIQALQRARAVAAWLMRLGLAPDMVSVRGNRPGDEVTVHLVPAGAG
jgi:hypothetical protein